ncbi:MAG: hypothetical protein GWN58_57665, partial [Anaerolineae bacterium]|nr:hypothetical protein [Anaerolineae bacterium]
PPPPSYEDDPAAYLRHQNEQIQKQLQAQQEAAQQQQQTMQQQQQQVQQVVQELQRREQRFVSEHPDYYDALDHVRQVERARLEPVLRAQGMGEAQIEQYMGQYELEAGFQWMQAGLDPAQMVYQMAQAYRYEPKPKGEGK